MQHALTVQSHQLLVPTELYGMMARAFTPISQALKLSNCKRCADYGLITPLKSAASGLNQQHFLQTIRLSMKADFHSLDVVDKIMDSCYAGLHLFSLVEVSPAAVYIFIQDFNQSAQQLQRLEVTHLM